MLNVSTGRSMQVRLHKELVGELIELGQRQNQGDDPSLQ
jgi:hypothetical protein